MYLVDTSVWIQAQGNPGAHKAMLLRQLLSSGAKMGVCGPVIQEFLQGARDPHHLQKMMGWMLSQNFHAPADPLQCSVDAAALYARCRWRGMTPRSSNDCLIACIAIEHGLMLLHDDRDYETIARIEPRLRLA